MSTYAIGDIQGCFEPLSKLLDKLNFDPSIDILWFAGDLINRGPHSLETLRFIVSLGDRAVCVLGNHDLHFLAIIAGNTQHTAHDTYDELLAASDVNQLTDWLRTRPLMHYDELRNTALIHAGLPPQWTIHEALIYAREVEAILQGSDYSTLVTTMYGNNPEQWDPSLLEMDRYRFIINCFTRMRYCDVKGGMDFKYKDSPGTQPDHLHPWYSLKDRKSYTATVLFGHWSAVGFSHQHNTYALDSGCLWGRTLTALNIDTKQVINVNC